MLAIVIPTYNEAENIEKLIKKIFALKIDLKLIIVDDNSPDGTGKIVEKLKNRYKNLTLISEKKQGLGSAYKRGFKYVLDKIPCDYIQSMDADFSHNPQDIPRFIEKIKQGYDIVTGSRYIKGGAIKNWNLYRKIVSRTANLISKIILGLPVHDLTGAFRCYKKKTIAAIDFDKIKSEGYSFLEEILFICNQKKFRMTEIPIIFEDRKLGTSKLSKKEIFKFFITLIRLGTKRILCL